MTTERTLPRPATAAGGPGPGPFGHAMRAQWGLDPAILYLNHGTVGATPRRVLAAQQSIRDEAERQPARFMLRELTEIVVGGGLPSPPRMRVAAEIVAAFVGARGEDLVFVENATTGVNAVLRSFPLKPGDEILMTDLGYGAVGNAAQVTARFDPRTGEVLALGALDNLGKGASGQALQCANLVLGLPEAAGLPTVGVMP